MSSEQPAAFLERSRAALRKLIQANKALGVNQEFPSAALRDAPELGGMYGTANNRRQPSGPKATLLASESAPCQKCPADAQKCDEPAVYWTVRGTRNQEGTVLRSKARQTQSSDDFSELRTSSPSGVGDERYSCATTTPRSLPRSVQLSLMPRGDGGGGKTMTTQQVLGKACDSRKATEACLSQNRQSDGARSQSTFEAWRQQGQVWRRALDDVTLRVQISVSRC